MSVVMYAQLIEHKFIIFDCLQDLTRKWGEVRTLVPQRDATLQAELRKQQSILFLNLEQLHINILCCEFSLTNLLRQRDVETSIRRKGQCSRSMD